MLKNLALAGASIVLTIAAVAAVAELYARQLGIRDPEFRYENELLPWRVDRKIGFVNRSNLREFCCGNVRVETNERDFRGGRPTAALKSAGSTRIIGVGDSVMWGAWVNREDSWLGVLERELGHAGDFEVVNAGVIGYSTYQEMLLIEELVLPLEPDVILVNHCDNDFLPTEDPFANVSTILLRRLEALIAAGDETFSARERKGLGRLRQIFRSEGPVWPAIQDSPPIVRRMLERVFLDAPIERMAELARRADARLVFVFIPSRSNIPGYEQTLRRLKRLMKSQRVDFVDLAPVLRPDEEEIRRATAPQKLGFRWIPIPALRQIQRLRNVERAHRETLYLDRVHLTRRGNAAVGRAVYERLRELLESESR
jgi:lysophospholipase L1-like esterase